VLPHCTTVTKTMQHKSLHMTTKDPAVQDEESTGVTNPRSAVVADVQLDCAPAWLTGNPGWPNAQVLTRVGNCAIVSSRRGKAARNLRRDRE
jgi:hypothetical protein